MRFERLFVLVVIAMGCSPKLRTINIDPATAAPKLSGRVVVEPFSEAADLQSYTATSTSTVYLSGSNRTATVQSTDTKFAKPWLARPDVLRRLSEAVIASLPQDASVVSTLALTQYGDETVTLVRPVVLDYRMGEDNVGMHTFMTVLGCLTVCPAWWLYPAIVPARKVQHVRLGVQLFQEPASTLFARQYVNPLISAPFVQTQGMRFLGGTELSLEVKVEGGYLGSEPPGDPDSALIKGVAQKFVSALQPSNG